MKLVPDFKTETELNEQETEVLKEFFNSVGWKIFEKVVKNMFNKEYKKLRNTRRKDESYERINGHLDGYERILNKKDEFH